MPLLHPFETSFGVTTLRRILLIEAQLDGVSGWAECVAGETPFYSPETIETAWSILKNFIWPILKESSFDSANDVWGLMERVRGHNMAKAGIEAAIWDAEAKQKGIPLRNFPPASPSALSPVLKHWSKLSARNSPRDTSASKSKSSPAGMPSPSVCCAKNSRASG